MPTRAETDDLLQGFRFKVVEVDREDADGFLTAAAGFNNVTIPEISVEEATYREGNRVYTMKFPGIPTVENSTYQRGVARTDREFFDWLHAGVLGRGKYRADHLIKQFDQTQPGTSEEDEPARQLKLGNAFPIRVKPMGDFAADSSDVSIAEVEVSVEELELKVRDAA